MADQEVDNTEVVESPKGEEAVEEKPQEPEVQEEANEEPQEVENQEEQPEQIKEQPQEERVSRRAEKRIQSQSLKIKNLLAEKAELERRLPENPKGLDYSRELEADDETISRLDADRKQYGESAYSQGLEQAKSLQFHTRLEVDAPRVESKYPQFNAQAEEFNPGVADAINSMYLSAVGYDPKTDTVRNPSLRYSDYVGAVMELVDAAAGEKVSKTQRNIVSQVANTGLRPSGGTAKQLNLEQPVEQMSDEELKAYGKKLGMRV